MLKVIESLNTQKNILHEIPDPKFYSTALFYRANNIPFKDKAMFACDRVAQLDEAFKGKEKFTGDSLMIADLNRNRKSFKEFVNKNKLGIVKISCNEDDLDEVLIENKG